MTTPGGPGDSALRSDASPAGDGRDCASPAARLRAHLDSCVHCGMCLPACPTYELTGSELDSPRGRIDLVRGLTDGSLDDTALAARHLDRCLGCRACEPACPSGVPYGAILEAGRQRLGGAREAGAVVNSLLAAFESPAATTRAMRLARLARLPVVGHVARALPGALGAAARLAPDAAWLPWSQHVPPLLPARGPRRGAVAMLPGCVMDHAFGRVHDATVALLRAAGFDVRVPRGPVCCGALHAHVGEAGRARSLADTLAASLADGLAGGNGAEPAIALVADAAGCGSHLKETPGPWAGRVRDVLEFLDAHGLPPPIRDAATALGVLGVHRPPPAAAAPVKAGAPALRVRAVWAPPCHLEHAQRVREAPLRLLSRVPGLDLVALRDADRCCGSAGVYNIAQPEMAATLLAAKVAAVRDASPDVLLSANPGCQLQIAAGLRCESAGSALRFRRIREPREDSPACPPRTGTVTRPSVAGFARVGSHAEIPPRSGLVRTGLIAHRLRASPLAGDAGRGIPVLHAAEFLAAAHVSEFGGIRSAPNC